MHRKSSISIREWLENSNKALLVTGIRRYGKSILLKQIMDEMKEDQGVTDDHIIYKNLEDMKYAFIKNAMDLYGYVEKLIVDEEKYYIFLDENQMVEEFERAINSLLPTSHTFPENETASPENSRIFRITMLLILPTTASYWNP